MEEKINSGVTRTGETDIRLNLIDSFPNHPYHVFDDEAIIMMVDSNCQRSKILPSEKAFSYKMKLEAIKRQGMQFTYFHNSLLSIYDIQIVDFLYCTDKLLLMQFDSQNYYHVLDDTDMSELVASIEVNGLLSPIVVRVKKRFRTR